MRQLVTCGIAAALLAAVSANQDDPLTVGDVVATLTRDSAWTLVASVPMTFRTYHPQGMVKIGETLFISSVEVRVRTRRFPQIVDGRDRDTGEGVGHLFKADLTGKLLARTALGEGAIYHPGGIDFDGTHIWVPVAEYRPNSWSIVYRVHPADLQGTEVFRFDDHLGAVVRNRDDDSLHAVSWGSRHFYRWALGADGGVRTAAVSARDRMPNPSHYVDYQDCQYAGRSRMLCAGVADLRPSPDALPYRLGGVDLVDLRDGRPLHQVPIPLRTPRGLPMTQNPVWFEPHSGGLRAYFMPEDDSSTLYIYEAIRQNAARSFSSAITRVDTGVDAGLKSRAAGSARQVLRDGSRATTREPRPADPGALGGALRRCRRIAHCM